MTSDLDLELAITERFTILKIEASVEYRMDYNRRGIYRDANIWEEALVTNSHLGFTTIISDLLGINNT